MRMLIRLLMRLFFRASRDMEREQCRGRRGF
jgi:hypothetical protein